MDCNDPELRRHAVVVIAGPVFQDMLTKGWSGDGIKCSHGLPPDAEFLGWAERFNHPHDIIMYFKHESFEATEPRDELPVVNVMFSLGEPRPVADYDAPLTPSWMIGEGWEYDEVTSCGSVRIGAGLRLCRYEKSTCIKTHDCFRVPLEHVSTVGEFKRLCETFDITLREPT